MGRAVPIFRDLGVGALCLLVSAALLWSWWKSSPWVPLLAAITYLGMAGLILASVPCHWRGLGWANRVTLGRGILIALLTGTLAEPDLLVRYATPLAALALLALLLDGIDGWVARRTSAQSDFGARFDMELDAFLILVLCLALLLLGKAGPWVLAIGAMRYAFIMAGLKLTWLTAALPESRRRKAICVWQVAALMISLLPIAGATATSWLTGSALIGLLWSFIIDIRWLYRHAPARRPEDYQTGNHS
ncbi:CDP-alcohol phosphatidyltransferase family protein [Halomonas daqiaonensis]|nr:CDP-alcohol phosphatidyltransferase family protein [Halomonas daqiaonensis]